MTNALAAFIKDANLPAFDEETMAAAIDASQEEEGYSQGGGITFIDFSGKMNQYRVGKDRDPIDPEALFLLEPISATKGWICWKGGKVVGREEWPYLNKAATIPAEHLGDHGPYKEGDGWKPLRGFGCVALDGSAGNYKFSSNAAGARNSIEGVLSEVSAQVKRGQPSVPVIKFSSESFTANDHTNWKPTFPIVAWVTREAAQAFFAGGSLDDLLAGKQPKKLK
jgi:hypothetical protein